METIHGRLLGVAGADGGRAALHCSGLTITYGELAARCRAVAATVASKTGHGDRVAMVAPNGLWWVFAHFGIPMSGRVMAAVSPRLTVHEIRDMLEVSDAAAVIVDDRLVGGDLSLLAAPGRTVMGLDTFNQMIGGVDVGPGSLDTGSTDFEPTEVAWLMFTSGTTGRPRAAALSHANLLAAVDSTAAVRPLAPDDVYLYPFPLWHVAAYNVLSRLTTGRQVVLQTSFDTRRILSDIDRYQATTMSVAATMLEDLLAVADADPGAQATLRGLRELHYGAAPMPATTLRRTLELLAIDAWQGYGMTELSGNAVFLSADDHRRGLADSPELLRATGTPAPGVEVRTVDDSGDVVAAGAVGEVVVRGAQVMVGYWNDPSATADVISPDGWLRTGDLGVLSADGLLSILDRKKDVIITGGENVSAREVEEVLRRHPDVADVAVVGVPDARWGENVCAVLVNRGPEPIDVGSLRALARETLAGFKVPRHVWVIDRLPVNASGKVVKAALRSRLREDPSVAGPRLGA